MQQRKYKEALKEYQEEKECWRDLNPVWELSLAVTRERLGEKGAIQEALGQMIECSKHEHVPPSLIAFGYFALGKRDRGFEWLEKAYEERDGWLFSTVTDPVLDDYQSDPRYTALQKRMGLAG